MDDSKKTPIYFDTLNHCTKCLLPETHEALSYDDSAGTLTITGQQGDITGIVAGTGLTGDASSGEATLNVVGGTGITANANDIEVDTSVVTTLSGTQTLTNKTLTTPVIAEITSGSTITLNAFS